MWPDKDDEDRVKSNLEKVEPSVAIKSERSDDWDTGTGVRKI